MEVQFDPGFVRHLSAFMPSIEYIYGALAQCRNFNQKKMQFKMYYPRIQGLIKNYLGFYLGCMLWAIYIKQYKNADILNNLCYGGEYSEEETLSEVNFMEEYLEQLKKDAKYYAGMNYAVDESYIKIIKTYREFLKVNKGFINVKTTDDVVIPDSIKTSVDIDFIHQEIEKVIDNGNLYELLTFSDKVL